MEKTLLFRFAVLCVLLTASAAMAVECTSDIWPADLDGDCRVQLDDFATLAENYGGTSAWVPYLDEGGAIRIEAEDCNLSGDYQIDEGTAVIVAADPCVAGSAAFINHQGIGSFTMPVEIPAGEYAVRINWMANAWPAADGGGAFGFNGITENGSVEPAEWHTFTAAAGTSAWNVDELAGPSMGAGISAFDSSGWATEEGAFATSITIPANNLGTIQLDFWETVTLNYAVYVIDYFEFVPIINPDPSIYIQAVDCNLSGDYQINDGAVIVSADPCVAGSNAFINHEGIGTFTMPVEIPADEYYLSIKWSANGWLDDITNGAIGFNGITENGSGEPAEWHNFTALTTGAGEGPRVEDELAGPTMGAGSSTLSGSGWAAETGAFGTSITVGPNNLGTISIDIWETNPGNYAVYIVDYFKFEPVVPIPGDIDNSRTVDINDLSIFAAQWLNCNHPTDPTCTDIYCNAKPAVGTTEYVAYIPDGPVTINGNLDDWPAFDYTDDTWCASKWVAMDKLYFGTENFIEDVYMCLMYDASTDIVYGAVIAHDLDPQYGPVATWDAQDNIEIYIQGDADNDTPVSPFSTWANAQQLMVGLNADETSTYMLWPNSDDFSTGPDPGLTAVVARVENGTYDHDVIYEFAVVPYDNYGGFDASTTVQSDLYSGKTFGFDVILGNYSPFLLTFSMHSANLLATPPASSKAYDVTTYGIAVCE